MVRHTLKILHQTLRDFYSEPDILKCYQARSQGEGRGREDSPPVRLKQVQFALNRKHAFFDATPSTTGLKSSSFHHLIRERQYHNITFSFLKVAQLVSQVFKQLI